MFSRNQLKLIAIVAMLIDHIGLLLLNNMIVLRGIGRLAFPIFTYLLVDGMRNTRDIGKYARRILFAWAISIVPYSLAFYGQVFSIHQNIYLSQFLFLGIFCMLGADAPVLAKSALVLFFAALAEVANLEYGWYGVIIAVLLFYYDNIPRIEMLGLFVVVNILYGCFTGNWIQMLSTMAVFFLPGEYGMPESQRPSRAVSIVSYLFYPVHLMFLTLLKM